MLRDLGLNTGPKALTDLLNTRNCAWTMDQTLIAPNLKGALKQEWDKGTISHSQTEGGYCKLFS